MLACVCLCASGGHRRTEEEIWHIWRGTQPGGGAQSTGMRQHPSADDRPAACTPTREGRTRHTHTHTHCTSSNSFTARAVWVGGLLLQRQREREQFAVSVCECVHMRHMSQLFIKTPARFNTSMTIFADNYRKNTSGRKSSKFKV